MNLPAPLRVLLPVLWRTALFFLAFATLSALVFLPFASTLSELEDRFPIRTQLYTGAVGLVAMLAATWLMTRFVDRRRFVTIGLAPAHHFRDLGIGLAMGTGWLAASVGTAWAAGWRRLRAGRGGAGDDHDRCLRRGDGPVQASLSRARVRSTAILLLAAAAASASGSTGDRRILCFDEAHKNVHLAAGSYAPVVALAAEVGLSLRVLDVAWTREALAGCDVLVSAGPRGAGRERPLAERGRSAFSDAEVGAVGEWVAGGGGLLLVTDHAPIGGAAAPLGRRLGVDMSDAFTEDPDRAGEEPGEIVFSRGAGLAAGHPITEGRSGAASGERVDRVSTFVGQSLAGPPGSVSLLTLGPGAVDRARRSPDGFVWEDPSLADPLVPAGGRSQAVALQVGTGRVVVLGEAAMLTERGFTAPGHNRRFALNLLRWLAGWMG